MTGLTKTLLVLLVVLPMPLLGEIRAGDTLEIFIKGVPPGEKAKVEGTYVVGGSGTIRLPILDLSHPAAGKSGEQLARSIEKAYREAEVYAAPTIEVLTNDAAPRAAAVVSVGGEVARSGPVPFRPGMTIVQAIQAAGDFTVFATKRRVDITRAGKTFRLDLRRAKDRLVEVRAGDTIEVDHRKPWETE